MTKQEKIQLLWGFMSVKLRARSLETLAIFNQQGGDRISPEEAQNIVNFSNYFFKRMQEYCLASLDSLFSEEEIESLITIFSSGNPLTDKLDKFNSGIAAYQMSNLFEIWEDFQRGKGVA